MSNALQRILTALVAIPLVLFVTYAGGWIFALMVLVAAVVAQHEFYALARNGGARPFVAAGLVAGGAAVLAPIADLAVVVAGASIVGVVLALPFVLEREKPLLDLSVTLGGVFYPSLMLATATALRSGRGLEVMEMDAFWLVVTVLVMVWASDSFAYFAGRAFGRHPLAPAVSPKKTWEGTAGGAAGALVAGIILKILVLGFLSWFDVGVLAIICGGISQIGDLAESRLKRSVGVKDSGTLLPGHGGMLDRLDALIVAIPLSYLYLVLVGRIWVW